MPVSEKHHTMILRDGIDALELWQLKTALLQQGLSHV